MGKKVARFYTTTVIPSISACTYQQFEQQAEVYNRVTPQPINIKALVFNPCARENAGL